MRPNQPNPTRREILAALACTGGALLLGPERLLFAEIDPRVQQIVSKTIAIDLHSHVQVRFTKDPQVPAIDLAGEIKRSGFSAVCQTYALDGIDIQKTGEYYERQQQALAFEDALLAQNHMRRALNMKDLEAAHDQHEPIIIQSVEGAQFIEGRLERIEDAYKRGLRHLQLLHERDDLVSPLGDVYTASATHLGGLTPFGAQVIRECNRLGIVVDLAHGTSATVTAALKAAQQPLIISHTGLDTTVAKRNGSVDMQRRMVSKDQARAIADAGGVIGVWWRVSDLLADYVAGIKDMIDAAGIDHVAIGTDTDLTASYSLPYTNKIWPDQNAGFFYAVAGEMLRQGLSPDEIGKIGGGNFCRVFAKVTAAHS
jgi:membrane dipeptidase